jgi:hypothetical protein
MPKFNLPIERSAVETATLEVEAESFSAAEDKIRNALDSTMRIDLDALSKLPGVKIKEIECSGDEESSWELT